MRSKVNVLYYPDSWPSHAALLKAILIFDEIHFMDRPSFTFNGKVGLVGSASPMRQFENSFRENGVPIYVHSAPGGPVTGELMRQVHADLSDVGFLGLFQSGLKVSPRFRDLQISPGSYGDGRTSLTIAQQLAALNLEEIGNGIEYVERKDVNPFQTSTEQERMAFLAIHAGFLSAKMNFALEVSSRYGFSPFADAEPFQQLMTRKYRRAILNLNSASGSNLLACDLCSSILDEVLPRQIWATMKVEEIVKYRRESEKAREEFLEYLGALESKLNSSLDSDYQNSISKIVEAEVTPAAKAFRNNLTTIYERMFGTMIKDAMSVAGGTAFVEVFSQLSWQTLVAAGGLVGAAIGKAAVDALLAKREAKRECAISYLLDAPGA